MAVTESNIAAQHATKALANYRALTAAYRVMATFYAGGAKALADGTAAPEGLGW